MAIPKDDGVSGTQSKQVTQESVQTPVQHKRKMTGDKYLEAGPRKDTNQINAGAIGMPEKQHQP